MIKSLDTPVLLYSLPLDHLFLSSRYGFPKYHFGWLILGTVYRIGE